jgi:hypothetical protein
MKSFFVFAVVFCILGVTFLSPQTYAGDSINPRQTGEEVLYETLLGANKLIVRVASNGCTDKGSFKVDVKKEAGFPSKEQHYVLTIKRVRPDECKAIVDNGALVLFDLEKDLGLKGDFSYSITNQIFSSSKLKPSDESLLSIIEKYFTSKSSELKVIKKEKTPGK